MINGRKALVSLASVLMSVVACLACASSRFTVSHVSGGVWRSAQPKDPRDWAMIRKLGIRRIVKLNFADEGGDAAASEYGITVYYAPLEPSGDENPIEALANVFKPLDDGALVRIEDVLEEATPEEPVLVHCTHGMDRTGLVIARYRVLHDGWAPRDAMNEALSYGYHPELVALETHWLKFAARRR